MPTTRVIAATAPLDVFLLTLRQQRKQYAAKGTAIYCYEQFNTLNLLIFSIRTRLRTEPVGTLLGALLFVGKAEIVG